MRFITEQGEEVQGASAPDVVEALRATGRFTADQSPDEYMADFAQRLRTWSETEIEFTDADTFVSELVRVGWLTPTE